MDPQPDTAQPEPDRGPDDDGYQRPLNPNDPNDQQELLRRIFADDE